MSKRDLMVGDKIRLIAPHEDHPFNGEVVEVCAIDDVWVFVSYNGERYANEKKNKDWYEFVEEVK